MFAPPPLSNAIYLDKGVVFGPCHGRKSLEPEPLPSCPAVSVVVFDLDMSPEAPGEYEMRSRFEFTLKDYGQVSEFWIDLIFPSKVLAQDVEVISYCIAYFTHIS